jgi:glycosyltransferase involved in cell wall biosynthesis
LKAGRVLHLIDTGGPGGAETVCLDLASRDSPAAPVVVLPERDWLWAACEARGIEPILLRSTRSFDLGYVRRLASIARARGVSLIQTHLLGSAVYGAAVGRLLRIPQVSTFHGTVDVSIADRYLNTKVRILDRASARLVFVSRSLMAYFEEVASLRRARSHVVYNGIDLGVFRPGTDPAVRLELGARDGMLLLGAIGNVRPAKDYAGLLRALAELRSRGVEVRCVVVGQVSEESAGALHALSSELGIDDMVQFVGFREDVERVLRALDVMVVSSSSEGFSLATVQALAAGTPVVATKCGGPEEILYDGEGGLLVPPRDPVALADGLQRVCSDSGLRATLASQGRRIAAERFDADAMVAKYRDIYRELWSR